jgi:thiol:disulfide interchange protein DsbC
MYRLPPKPVFAGSQRFLLSAVMGFVVLFSVVTSAHAFKEGNQNCFGCHQLANKDAVSILEKLNLGGAKILAIQASPVKGFWEVAVENKGQRFVVYVDFSKKFVTPGPLIDYASRRDVTKDRIEALNRDRKIDVSKLSLAGPFVVGKTDAPIKVVVFTDPG